LYSALTAVTAVNSVGRGAYLTGCVLYFTEAVHLSAGQVGLGLSIAGLVALAVGVPSGHFADRHDARTVYLATLLTTAVATATFSLTGGFWSFLAAACLATSAHTASVAARGPIIAQLGGDRPQRLRGQLRAITNIGIAVGALAAGVAVQVGTHAAYLALILATAALFLAAAGLVALLPTVRPHPTAGAAPWTALADRLYLTLTLLDGALAIQYKVLTVAVPLWLISHTRGPTWLIAGIMIVNTVLVGALQVRVSQRITSPKIAGRALRTAGLLFLASCSLIALTAGAGPSTVIALLLAAVVIHTLGELQHAAGGFEISFALAPDHAVGQYQGLFGMGLGLADAVAPALLTALCINWGRPGWYATGAILALAGLLAPLAVRAAQQGRTGRLRTRPGFTASPPSPTGPPIA
jgi:MFS family permease